MKDLTCRAEFQVHATDDGELWCLLFGIDVSSSPLRKQSKYYLSRSKTAPFHLFSFAQQ